MTNEGRSRLLGTASQRLATAVCGGLGLALVLLVDLTPRVEGDFFFSSDDPQFRQSAEITKEFGSAEQVFVAAHSTRLASRRYLTSLRDLTHDLARLDGVADARSLTHGPEDPADIGERDPEDVFEDLADSPFWSGLLLAPDRSATFVVLRLSDTDTGHEATVSAIDDVLARYERPGFELAVTGVPYVSEHIRRQLARELWRFSLAAFAAFALLIGLLFRSAAVVAGTMVAALTACFATFLVRALFGMPVDILTPNLWTIAFVLTLSHVVYLTAEWQQGGRGAGRRAAIAAAMRRVAPASAWSLFANLLGFASLMFVTAKPLRQFGLSGAMAAVLAMACAYVLFPPFLRAAARKPERTASAERGPARFFTTRHPRWAAVAVIVAALLAPFAWRVNTDPSLPTYFADGGPVRIGLERIDEAAGSSPLDLVVEDARGGQLDDDDAFERLEAAHRALERHPDVGSVVSIALLMAETERPWYSFLLSWERRLDRLDSPEHGRIGRTFLSDDRRRGRFILRMRELARDRPRAEVVADIAETVRGHGLEPVLIAGLYPMQGELSELVGDSVRGSLAGLIALFGVIVFLVTRSAWTAAAMTACLLLPPFVLFGAVGLLGMPVDIISAPAANVALPLGIDEMIHLGYALRRSRRPGQRGWPPWSEALDRLWRPILASALIVASGFSLFLLSSFPPTARLGLLVCAGVVVTDLVVLVVMPALATARLRGTPLRQRR